MKPLPVVKAGHGLYLRALVDVEQDEQGVPRKAGDEWQLKGPVTYVPNPDVVSVCVIIVRGMPIFVQDHCIHCIPYMCTT